MCFVPLPVRGRRVLLGFLALFLHLLLPEDKEEEEEEESGKEMKVDPVEA